MMRNRTFTKENDRDNIKQFLSSWPSSIVHIHPFQSKCGCIPVFIPGLYNRGIDTYGLWVLLTCACNVNEMWETIVQSVYSAKEWSGWFIEYAMNHVLKT